MDNNEEMLVIILGSLPVDLGSIVQILEKKKYLESILWVQKRFFDENGNACRIANSSKRHHKQRDKGCQTRRESSKCCGWIQREVFRVENLDTGRMYVGQDITKSWVKRVWWWYPCIYGCGSRGREQLTITLMDPPAINVVRFVKSRGSESAEKLNQDWAPSCACSCTFNCRWGHRIIFACESIQQFR